jgi:DNA-binding transcriptional LysR family regulator
VANITRRKADWSNLRVFWVVAETGGFGAAARALGVNQSTVTRRIDELEHQLNTRLFVRGISGVSLTPAGLGVYDRALTMERSAEAIENLVADADETAQGRVGLSAPDGLAAFLMTPHLPDFMRANPSIDLSIDCGLWPDHPLEGGADLSLTFEEPKQADLIAKPIAHFHYAMFAARAYLDLYGEPRSLQETTTHPFVHHVAQVHQPENWHKQTAAFQGMSSKRIETNSSAACLMAVKAGAGIGLLPTAVLSVEPGLVMLNAPVMGSLKLWLCYHRDVARSARIRRVIDWMREVFDPRTNPWYREEFVHPDDFSETLSSSQSRPGPMERSSVRERPAATGAAKTPPSGGRMIDRSFGRPSSKRA